MIFKVNGIHHEVDFPVLKLQFLGAQHIHASRGIWEARDSSVIQNVLCLGFDGPIPKIFRKMMNMGYWCIRSEAIHIYILVYSIYLFISYIFFFYIYFFIFFLLSEGKLFLRGAKTWRGTKIFLRASETQRGGTIDDDCSIADGTYGSTWIKDGYDDMNSIIII